MQWVFQSCFFSFYLRMIKISKCYVELKGTRKLVDKRKVLTSTQPNRAGEDWNAEPGRPASASVLAKAAVTQRETNSHG